MAEAERGEVWWSTADEMWPVVLVSGSAAGEFLAMQLVAAATEEQKRGSVLLTPEEAAHVEAARAEAAGVEAAHAEAAHAGATHAEADAGPGRVRGDARPARAGEHTAPVGVEVPVGFEGGAGVVRVALPTSERIFCTWQITLTAGDLTRRAGVVADETMRRLELALRLAGILPAV
ncbi:hypothetical protein [Symbioplanes lichenis]|uniref:hypothetical protein n=1 Tax=Symbioplanes lichenis TaxID=1629072 RepID=UPI0027384412|nr:hypothetical protein [Actinoplanes lichenis]